MENAAARHVYCYYSRCFLFFWLRLNVIIATAAAAADDDDDASVMAVKYELSAQMNVQSYVMSV